MNPIVRQIGAIVPELSESEARQLTEKIKEAAEKLWSLLYDAHEGRAWSALGYETWTEYVRVEFNMSKQRSFQILDQARVIYAINGSIHESTGVDSTSVEVSEAVARDLKPHMPEVLDRVRERTDGAPREEIARIVAEVVQEERLRINDAKESKENLERAQEGMSFPGEKDRVDTIWNLYEAIDKLGKLPSSSTVAAMIRPYERHRLEHLPKAIAWLTEFARHYGAEA
jgi:hypothetical protein